jgi:hypothetical protein
MTEMKKINGVLIQNDNSTGGLPPLKADPIRPRPEGKLPRSEQRCSNCSGCISMGGQLACAAHPPTPLFLGMGQSRMLVGGKPVPMPMVNAFYPPVSEDGWCREWGISS